MLLQCCYPKHITEAGSSAEQSWSHNTFVSTGENCLVH